VDSARRIALVTGIFFVITFITSIPAFFLYGPVLNDPSYIVGPGADGQVLLGAFLEILLAIANIGTAVALFPILKWENEGLALGYVASRLVESIIIVVGVVSLLAVVTLRQEGSGADDALVAVGRSLVAIHDWTFLVGPGFCVGVNDLLLGYLLYRAGLVPRWLALLGVIGGPLHFASVTAELFGVIEPSSLPRAITTIPVFAFEAILGIWLIVAGFKPAPIIDRYRRRNGD
jgi:hypothetical protein